MHLLRCRAFGRAEYRKLMACFEVNFGNDALLFQVGDGVPFVDELLEDEFGVLAEIRRAWVVVCWCVFQTDQHAQHLELVGDAYIRTIRLQTRRRQP